MAVAALAGTLFVADSHHVLAAPSPAAKATVPRPVAARPAPKVPVKVAATVPVKAAAKVRVKVAVHRISPPNPSNTQIANAGAVKAQAAVDVGRLSGLITGVDTKIQNLDDAAELAKENYLEALSKLSTAKTAATTAQKAVGTAATRVTAARTRFRLSVASSYMNRTTNAGSLLTAPNPTALLDRDQLDRYAQSRQSSGIDDLNRATVSKANADATARGAVNARTKASTTADQSARTAVAAVAAAKTQRVRLAAQKVTYQRQLQSAGERLTGLKDKRAAYLAWQQAELRRKAIEAARKAAERRRELAAQAREARRLEALVRQRAADERAAQAKTARDNAQAEQTRKDAQAEKARQDAQASKDREDAARRQRNRNASSSTTSSTSTDSGSSSSKSTQSKSSKSKSSKSKSSKSKSSKSKSSKSKSSKSNSSKSKSSKSTSSGSSSDSHSAVGGDGSWSPARGRAAVKRAVAKVGVRYSFAAGNSHGATLGVCIAGDSAWNDCHIRGYDCSGLTLYAWAGQGVHLTHYSKVQYDQGSVHPSIDNLMPGDLVFFSSNGSRSGIHHVAMYIGHDEVVQAPQSGERVKISSLWRGGYLGATRPGT